MAFRFGCSGGANLGASGSGCGDEEEGATDDEDGAQRGCNGVVRARVGFDSSRPFKLTSSEEAKGRDSDSVYFGKSGSMVFVGNLPFQASVRWLYATFQRFGKISDAFIPGKLSKGYGRKYGFVRFASGNEADCAIRNLDGARVGKWHLIVQKSKSNLGIALPICNEGIISVSKATSPSRGSIENRVSGGLSTSGSPGSRRRVKGMVKDLDWNQCAALALLRSGLSFSEMRMVILESCSFVRSVSLIKDNSVLIVFQSSFHRGLAIEHGFWPHWFYSVKEWDEGRAGRGNQLWVECVGIPFWAWNEVTFKAIASVWGSIIEVDSETSEIVHLASARLCISTLESVIEDIIELEVDGNIFDVCVSSSVVQNCALTKQVKCSVDDIQQSKRVRRIEKLKLEQNKFLEKFIPNTGLTVHVSHNTPFGKHPIRPELFPEDAKSVVTLDYPGDTGPGNVLISSSSGVIDHHLLDHVCSEVILEKNCGLVSKVQEMHIQDTPVEENNTSYQCHASGQHQIQSLKLDKFSSESRSCSQKGINMPYSNSVDGIPTQSEMGMFEEDLTHGLGAAPNLVRSKSGDDSVLLSHMGRSKSKHLGEDSECNPNCDSGIQMDADDAGSGGRPINSITEEWDINGDISELGRVYQFRKMFSRMWGGQGQVVAMFLTILMGPFSRKGELWVVMPR